MGQEDFKGFEEEEEELEEEEEEEEEDEEPQQAQPQPPPQPKKTAKRRTRSDKGGKHAPPEAKFNDREADVIWNEMLGDTHPRCLRRQGLAPSQVRMKICLLGVSANPVKVGYIDGLQCQSSANGNPPGDKLVELVERIHFTLPDRGPAQYGVYFERKSGGSLARGYIDLLPPSEIMALRRGMGGGAMPMGMGAPQPQYSMPYMMPSQGVNEEAMLLRQQNARLEGEVAYMRTQQAEMMAALKEGRAPRDVQPPPNVAAQPVAAAQQAKPQASPGTEVAQAIERGFAVLERRLGGSADNQVVAEINGMALGMTKTLIGGALRHAGAVMEKGMRAVNTASQPQQGFAGPVPNVVAEVVEDEPPKEEEKVPWKATPVPGGVKLYGHDLQYTTDPDTGGFSLKGFIFSNPGVIEKGMDTLGSGLGKVMEVGAELGNKLVDKLTGKAVVPGMAEAPPPAAPQPEVVSRIPPRAIDATPAAAAPPPSPNGTSGGFTDLS